MQVSVENTGSLERKIRVEVPDEKISSEVSNRLQRLSKTTKVQGFRPGKAPMKVIQGRYGVQVRQEVVGEMLQSSLFEALDQENLKPAGPPRIEEINDENGQHLAFPAVIEVFPEVQLKPVAELEVERPVCSVTDQEVTDMIDKLRQQQRTLQVVERASGEGDVVDIDFEGFLDGEAFEGGRAEKYKLELGSGNFIAGFEEGLVGKSAGDEATLKLKFPDDYGKEDLQGKDVEFKVKVNAVNEPVLPEVDAKFMEMFGVKDGDEQAFRDEIRRNMEREVNLTLRQQIKNSVLDALNEANDIELPQTMVSGETSRIREELAENMKRQGMDAGAMDKADDSLFTEQAQKRVALQLIVAEIIKANDIKADDTQVRAMVEDMASSYEDPNMVINWYYSDKKNLQQVEALVLEEEVINWVLANAKVTEKPSSFDEIMNKGQTDH